MAHDSPTSQRRRSIVACIASAVLLAGFLFAPAHALAQSWPSKSVRLVAPFAAGGAADTVARVLAGKLQESTGQTFVVENRAGASGAIGAAFVASQPADGYTLLVTLGPPHQTVQFFAKNVGYDPVKDFTPIMIVGTAPQALIVPAGSSIASVKDLVEAARKSPKGLSFATSGVGTSQHLAGLLLGSITGTSLQHVAYKGGSQAMNDVLGGQIDAGILVLSNALPHVKSGKVRVIGVVEASRAKSAPDIPTVAEGGIAGYAVPATWVGVLGPRDTPEPLVARIHAELAKAIADPDIRKRLEGAGYEVTGGSSAEFARQLAESVELYRSITTKAGIQPE